MMMMMMMSQLVQWLLQQVMHQLLATYRRPPLVIGRALDVLNATGSTRQEFQALFRPMNLGPGDIEELSPEVWEEFRPTVQELSMHC